VTGTALGFARFLFIVPQADDAAFRARLRAAGSAIARGFFNDFDADGTRETPAREAIQFLVADGDRHADSQMAAAPYVLQVTGNYRPRLGEVEAELRRRLGDAGGLFCIEGVERPPRYTNHELHEFAFRPAAVRRSGRVSSHALLLPIRKTAEWWNMSALERGVFFYPHVDIRSGCAVRGHVLSAAEGIPALFRRLYHNPDGYQREGEYDFLAYFECAPQDLQSFARVHRALQDTAQNPEWRYVQEGPLWAGTRVLRW
jgi:hypothetical protein